MEKVKFTQMKDGSKEDYLLLEKHEKKFIEKDFIRKEFVNKKFIKKDKFKKKYNYKSKERKYSFDNKKLARY